MIFIRPLSRLAIAVIALALAGCGTDPSAAPSRSAAPTGRPVTGDGYQLTIPAGWVDKTHDAAVYKATVRAKEGVGQLVLVRPLEGNVLANVSDVQGNIVVLRLNEAVPGDQLAAFAARSGGGNAASAPQGVTVGGEPGVFVSYPQDIQGTPGETEETLFNHGGRTYDVSLTTSHFAFTDQEQQVRSLLGSWRWKP